jgi:hypothetical protein
MCRVVGPRLPRQLHLRYDAAVEARGTMRIVAELTLWLLRLFLIALCVTYLWPVLAGVTGAADAIGDVMHGKLIVRELGLPAPWVPDASRVLAQSYGVHVSLGECMVSPARLTYVHGYNFVSMAAIRRKFGRDIVQQTDAGAEQAWNENKHSESDAP